MSLTIILADASLGFIYCPLGQALTRQDTTAPKMGRLGNDLCFLLCSTVLLVTVKLITSNEKHCVKVYLTTLLLQFCSCHCPAVTSF